MQSVIFSSKGFALRLVTGLALKPAKGWKWQKMFRSPKAFWQAW